ncbi:uncharacterized protein LOC116428520 [Nomia melanderi]|uniref:uncharacterized protein LOC116428520 n=1 Tax=Nomia melanderi TaxID=2448451 RepID=UPI003FCED940
MNEFFTMESSQEEKSLVKVQNSESSKISLDSETRLQSLGFIINNGKARFMLEDDTPIYSNAALTNFSITDPSDTLSFVVLGKDSMDFIQASSIASYVDIERKSMSVDYNSMIASWNSDEIHEKLSELLQENGKLKETLKQNNIAMKQQFNTLVNWQEEIMKIHQSHKKKFAETRELISYLQKENNEFKMRLATGGISTEPGYEMLSANEMQSTSDKKESSILGTELHEKVSSLTEELSNSKQKCEKLSSDVEKLLSISNLVSSQLKQATSTIQDQRLNIKKLEMQASMSKSYDSNHFNQSLNYNIPKCTEFTNKHINCENCLIKDKEINSLKESLVMLQHKLQHAILYEPETVLREKIEDITQTNMSTESVKDKTESVEQGIENKQSLEESMSLLAKEKERLKETEQLLDSQKKNLEMERKHLNEAMELLQQEKISLNEEKSSLDQQSQLYESHYKTVLETEKNKCDAKCSQLISEIGILHETVQKKELRVKELEAEIKQREEHIALLRMQLELYEEDFTKEKNQKERILAEKDELNDSLQRQTELNQQLLGDISTYLYR